MTAQNIKAEALSDANLDLVVGGGKGKDNGNGNGNGHGKAHQNGSGGTYPTVIWDIPITSTTYYAR